MKLHHILVYIFPPVVVAALVIGLAVEHHARIRLSDEHQALEQDLPQMAELAARNEQLSNRLAQATAPQPLPADELKELLRLRHEVGSLVRRHQDLDQAREQNRQTHAILAKYLEMRNETNPKATADYWPQNSWTNNGYGSPEAALQTMLWAASNGDLTNFFKSLDVGEQTNLDSDFKGKPTTEVSIRLADETYALKSVQVLGREALDDNSVLFTLAMERPDDYQTIKMLMKRTGDEWKFAGEK